MKRNNISKSSYELLKNKDDFFFIDYLSGEILFSKDYKAFKDVIKEIEIEETRLIKKNNNDRFDSLLHEWTALYNRENVLHIIIIPTMNCNFNCVYCYEKKSLSRMNRDVVKNIKKFISKQSLKYKTLFIEWFGGEHLLEMEIILDIINHAEKVCGTYNINLFSHITTNGSLLNLKTIASLINHSINSFTVTIDGIAKSHDRYRCYNNGDGSYEKIIKNLKEIYDSDLNYNIKLRSNMTAENIRDIDLCICF